jgi:cadmium resistance protein CadD (predicted permease)
MVIDIINDRYFKKTKTRKIFSTLYYVCYAALLLCLIGNFLFPVYNVSNYYPTLTIILALLGLTPYILGLRRYIKTGTVEFENDLMLITNKNIVNEINLRTVESIEIKNKDRELYTLKIGKLDILIELTLDNKPTFKNKLEQYYIKFDSNF